MELLIILLGAGAIGYLISKGGSRTETPHDGGGGVIPLPDCTTAINTLPEPLRGSIQSAISSPTATRDSLMSLAKTLDACPYPGIKDQCAFVAACIRAEAMKKPAGSDGGGGGGGGSTVDSTTCSNMINALPETTEEEKSFKSSLKAVWDSPVIIPTAVLSFADTLDKIADEKAKTDATEAARIRLIAGCMRSKAGKAAGF